MPLKYLSQNYNFSTRLIMGLLALIVITTLSAGLPAYWLTEGQLEAQMWAQVDTARTATRSLFQAREAQLKATAFLLSERPTMARLLTEPGQAELEVYLAAFRRQSQLDILLICTGNLTVPAAESPLVDCPPPGTLSYTLLAERPALLVSQMVHPQGVIVAGAWLDESFLQHLAVHTGAQQSIISPDGQRHGSSFTAAPAITAFPSDAPPPQTRLALPEGHYYATAMPLTGSDTAPPPRLFAEVALPVEALMAVKQQALLVLVVSTGLVAVGGGALGAWYIRRLTTPLRQLTGLAGQISHGDFTTHIPPLTGPAEITTLTAALNQSQAAMMAALEERSRAGAWLNTILQSIVEGVVTIDGQGRINFFTQGAETLTGWPTQKALGQPIDRVFLPAESNDPAFSERIPAPGHKQTIEIITLTGKRAVLAVTGARLTPPDAATAQTALVLRDVTDETARQHLRSYFLANITHEFRTPLSALAASLELLLDEADKLTAADIRELLKPTHLSLLSLQTLIDNLLESSRIEAGYFTLRRQRLNLNQILTEALLIVTPLLERRRQTLTLTRPGRLPDVEGDSARLIQVMVNLLINASKYSPIGQTIDLHLARTDDALRISVLDRGSGIPPAERLNLFRRFVRMSNQREQYGVGLGLYVVKTTIEAHGGQVGVDETARRRFNFLV
jgi:two-component system phosphate regulon sensor histidine kinase PhoR